MDENKARFLELCRNNIKREGIEDLLNWLTNESDFFTAPASTKYHCAYAGGLCKHSLNVYDRLIREVINEYGAFDGENTIEIKGNKVTLENITIIALFHDLSKTNFYLESMRSVKENGEWKQVPFYQVNPKPDPSMVYGTHAENSVYLLNNFIMTSHLENVCIRHHMGGKDFSELPVNETNTTTVFTYFPLALLTHIADMKATYIDEGNE